MLTNVEVQQQQSLQENMARRSLLAVIIKADLIGNHIRLTLKTNGGVIWRLINFSYCDLTPGGKFKAQDV